MTESRIIIAFAKYVAVKRSHMKPSMSQSELSARINKSPSYISQLERGKIDQLGLETFCDILEALGIGPGEWLIAFYEMEGKNIGGIQ